MRDWQNTADKTESVNENSVQCRMGQTCKISMISKTCKTFELDKTY